VTARWVKRLLATTLLCIASRAVAQVRINEICAAASERLIRWEETGQTRVGAGVSWYDVDFDASDWFSGIGPVGMGTEVVTNVQAQMHGITPSLYMRQTFSASTAQATNSESLTLEVEYTDGFAAYLNGKEIARKSAGAPGAPFMHDQVAFNGEAFSNQVWTETLTLDAASSLLLTGDNVLSIQSHDNDVYLQDTTLYCKTTLKTGGGQILAADDGTWSWFVGTHEPSGGVVDYGPEDPTALLQFWTGVNFDDSDWATGPGGIGYDRDDQGVVLGTDIESQIYGITKSFYMRRVFSVSDTSGMLMLSVGYDDGFVAYVNGVEVARRNAGSAGTFMPHTSGATAIHNIDKPPEIISLGAVQDALEVGDNVLAFHVLNRNVTSSDVAMIPSLYTEGGATHVSPSESWHYFIGTTEPVQFQLDSDFLDWVELKNEGAQPVSLAGWSLTDDAEFGSMDFPGCGVAAGQLSVGGLFGEGCARYDSAPFAYELQSQPER